ncbi:hypothetical protein PYCCODRAFT_1452500 [Trametes coccinea BRFM310]|uniref:Ribosome assembly protein 3 n=1 Tax=Trametes coccinea (strain BRFM310) TaxID=1353009 RepID=A0A1Y2IMP4_TRAC3|nr:hypothetical protein PYCCODRAFT_1452500 [Trametes coccinea BRFM310]
MAPPGPKPQAARKRTRKRKRRNVSDSSESSSSDSSSSDSDAPQQTAVVRIPVKGKAAKRPQPQPAPPSESSSSSSSSSESDSDDPDVEPARELSTLAAPNAAAGPSKPARRTPSPTPPPSSVPSFLPGRGASEQERQNEQVLKERFRKFWMASVADAFKDDLEEIRKHEPNLTTARLAMLIDSLAAGGDVLTSSRVEPDSGMTEMEIVLEHNT